MTDISRLQGQISALAILFETMISNEMIKWGDDDAQEFVADLLSLNIEGGITEENREPATAAYELLHSILTRSLERARILGFEDEA